MEPDKAPKLLGELRQLVDRLELELGARPVWWRRHPATQTKGAREESKASAASRKAPAKRDRAKLPKPKTDRGAVRKRAAGAATDQRRAAGR